MDEKTKRPHTINGSNGMHQRPGLNGHTFMPTNSNVSFCEFSVRFWVNSTDVWQFLKMEKCKS